MKQNFPVTYLLFTSRGRIDRLTFWTSQLFIWLAFYILYNLLELFVSYTATLLVYPLLYYFSTFTVSLNRMLSLMETCALVVFPIQRKSNISGSIDFILL